MVELKSSGISEFLRFQNKMVLLPITNTFVVIEGYFDFVAKTEKGNEISDSFHIRINIPFDFPQNLPIVYELDNRIPRNGQYHVNPDSSLCLGSPLRVLWKVNKNPTVAGFASDCLIPYLYAISHKLKYGGNFAFGELAHGSPGELLDYAELFGLKNRRQALIAIEYLGMKKRRANKLPCPCNCGKRLGKCDFNRTIREYRLITGRSWYRSLLL